MPIRLIASLTSGSVPSPSLGSAVARNRLARQLLATSALFAEVADINIA
jgi:hypothetical protein